MTAALGLGGFALFGWLTGIVFRRFFRGRGFGFLSYLVLRFLLGAVAPPAPPAPLPQPF